MQLAINIIIFFLGFFLHTVVVTRPQKAREDFIRNFNSRVRQVISRLRGQPPPDDLQDGEEDQEVVEDGSRYLLTKYDISKQHISLLMN